LRGVMGGGTNRMNKYTVGKATQGLSKYLRAQDPNQPIRVAVSYDSRNQSEEFARLVAAIFVANDIDVYIFKALRPTPHLSFAIRQLDCHSGVMVTASHNPKEYNGYKAYWKDGGQLVPPHDKGVISYVNAITAPSQIRFPEKGLEHAMESSHWHWLEEEMDEAYFRSNLALSLRPEAIHAQKDLKIVYSPIHGTGV